MGNGANIYPNFKLQPEQAYNLNLTLYGQAQWGGLHFLNYEATAFYRNVSNYIHRVVLGDVESQYDNVGSSLVLGGEMEVKYNYANLLDLTLNGTYTDERDRTRINIYGQPNPTYGYRIPNDPFLYGNLLLGANWRKPFGIQRVPYTSTLDWAISTGFTSPGQPSVAKTPRQSSRPATTSRLGSPGASPTTATPYLYRAAIY